MNGKTRNFPTAQDINEMTNEELLANIKQIREHNMTVIAKNKRGERIENPGALRHSKRTVARMMTVLAKRKFRAGM